MDKYEVLKKVGTGSYGSAYLVCSRQDPQQQYVLKKIQSADAPEKERQAALNEVDLLAKLDHPFVLGYFDHFTYKQQLCIITDYCEHGDLYQHMQKRRQQAEVHVPQQQALTWFVQMLLAIQHVHSHEVLHRDLKTQNLFLTAAGYIKLGDFGIARNLGNSGGLASTLIGTPYYMSPEVMQNLPYDYKSDIWSAGCVLYEMLAGRQAFDAEDMPGLMAKILAGAHQPMPARMSRDLQVLIMRMLSSNPHHRPTCEDILAMRALQPYVTAAQQLAAELQGKKLVARQLAAAAAALASPIPAAVGPAAQAANGVISRGRASPANSFLHKKPNNMGGDDGGDALDQELADAVERLRQIEAQREAVREQLVLLQQSPAAHVSGHSSGVASRSSINHLKVDVAAAEQPGYQQRQLSGQLSPKPSARASRSFTNGTRSSAAALAGAAAAADTPMMHQVSPSPRVSRSHPQITYSVGVGPAGPILKAAVAAALSNGSAVVSVPQAVTPGQLLSGAAYAAGAAAVAAIEQMLQPPASSGASSARALNSRQVSFNSRNRGDNSSPVVAVSARDTVADIQYSVGQYDAVFQAAVSAPASISNSARSSRRQIYVDPTPFAAGALKPLSRQGSGPGAAAGDGMYLQQPVDSSSYTAVQQKLVGLSSRGSSRRSILDVDSSSVAVAEQPSPRKQAYGIHSESSLHLLVPAEAAPVAGLEALVADYHNLDTPHDLRSPLSGHDDVLSSMFSSGSSSGENGSSNGGLATHAELLKARREARRAEELRRREAELEQARRLYKEERVAAEARASIIFEGSPGNCIIPSDLSTSKSASGASNSSRPVLKRSAMSQKSPGAGGDWLGGAVMNAGPAAGAGALGHSPSLSKPPLAGRRGSKQSIEPVAWSESEGVAAPIHGSPPTGNNPLFSPRTAVGPGGQQQGSPVPEAACCHTSVEYCGTGNDDEFNEEDIDKQLAALAAARKAKQAARSAAVMASISAKSLVKSPGQLTADGAPGGRGGVLKASSFQEGRLGGPQGGTSVGPPGGDWQLKAVHRHSTGDCTRAAGIGAERISLN